MGFYILGYVPNRDYSHPLGTRVVGYVPESVLFMVLNFLPSTLGNPHDHIWVFRWASLTRWHFHACAVVLAPQIDATHPDRMHGNLSPSWFYTSKFLFQTLRAQQWLHSIGMSCTSLNYKKNPRQTS